MRDALRVRDSREPTSLSAALPPELADAGVEIPFPGDVVALSVEIWRMGRIVEPDAGSRYEARARVRAALIRLRTIYPLEAWPRALVGGYRRTFRKRWATSEDGRGMRELLRVLGFDGGNETIARWLVLVVE